MDSKILCQPLTLYTNLLKNEMMEREYKITKSTVESYKLRHSSGMYWADITVDEGNESGRLQISSDYGDWQYYWGSCGKSFKDFLISLKDICYVGRKFNAINHFDAEENIKYLKQLVIEWRRGDNLDAMDARDCWDDIEMLQLDLTNDKNHFYHLLSDSNILRIFNYELEANLTYDPGFKEFWETVWPVFIEELKSEKIITTP